LFSCLGGWGGCFWGVFFSYSAFPAPFQLLPSGPLFFELLALKGSFPVRLSRSFSFFPLPSRDPRHLCDMPLVPFFPYKSLERVPPGKRKRFYSVLHCIASLPSAVGFVHYRFPFPVRDPLPCWCCSSTFSRNLCISMTLRAATISAFPLSAKSSSTGTRLLFCHCFLPEFSTSSPPQRRRRFFFNPSRPLSPFYVGPHPPEHPVSSAVFSPQHPPLIARPPPTELSSFFFFLSGRSLSFVEFWPPPLGPFSTFRCLELNRSLSIHVETPPIAWNFPFRNKTWPLGFMVVGFSPPVSFLPPTSSGHLEKILPFTLPL